MLILSRRLKLSLAFAIVPAFAVMIAMRQAYLKFYYGLSTWKGGGMGMFAGADDTHTRFAKYYLETPDGGRQPIVTVTDRQQALINRAMLYPVRSNFETVAKSMRKTNWQGPDNPVTAVKVDVDGNRVGPVGKPFYMLNANGLRREGDEPNWVLAIEYWNADYDPATGIVHAWLVDTMRF